MRLKPQHAPFMATQIVLQLGRSHYVNIDSTTDVMKSIATSIIKEDMKREQAIENMVRDLMDQNQDEIEYEQADEKLLFAKIKRQIAKEQGFVLDQKERYSKLAHDILDEFIEECCITCNVNNNLVKGLILKAFDDYMKLQEIAYNNTIDKIRNYKRKLVPGSEEYEIIFFRMYEEELIRTRG